MLLNKIAACVKRMVSVPKVCLKDALSCLSCVYDTWVEVEQLLCFSKTAAMLKQFSVQRECAVLRAHTFWCFNCRYFQTLETCKEQEYKFVSKLFLLGKSKKMALQGHLRQPVPPELAQQRHKLLLCKQVQSETIMFLLLYCPSQRLPFADHTDAMQLLV